MTGTQNITVSGLVLEAETRYLMPEMQRTLVWTVQKCVDLVDSLLSSYPIGTIELWQLGSDEFVPVRSNTPIVAAMGSLFVVDGQQRTTALVAVCGRSTPSWVVSEAEVTKFRDMRTRVCYNVLDDEVVETAVQQQKPGSGLVRLNALCTAQDDDAVDALVEKALSPNHHDLQRAKRATMRARDKLVNRAIGVETSILTLAQADESFTRLNTKGISLNQGDLVVSALSARAPGFVLDTLWPYIAELQSSGLASGNRSKIQDAVLRSLLTYMQVKVGLEAAVRFRDIDFKKIPLEDVRNYWPAVTDAWNKVLAYFRDLGIDTSAIKSLNELAPLVLLTLKFPTCAAVSDNRLAALWLYMRRGDRYVKQSTDAHALDAPLWKCGSFEEAYAQVALSTKIARRKKFNAAVEPFTAEELLDAATFDAVRNSVYGSAYVLSLDTASRRDPVTGVSLHLAVSGGRKKGAGSDTQWHHIFPQALISKLASPVPKWNDTMANLSLITAPTNNAWADRTPALYLAGIPAANLTGQRFDLATGVTDLVSAERFVKQRAAALAESMNWFFDPINKALATVEEAVSAADEALADADAIVEQAEAAIEAEEHEPVQV